MIKMGVFKLRWVDDGELEYFCGTVARKKELTPLEFSDWRKVPATTKDKIWDLLR